MKKMVLMFTAALMFNVSAHATAPTFAERIQSAVNDINSVAEGHDEYQVTPSDDVYTMMASLAEKLEAGDDFADRWVGDDSSAWEADSGNWGSETLAGAQSYVIGTLEQYLEEGDLTDEAKIKFVDDKLKVERAFRILGSIKSIKYGVSAYGGAVQCGISFPSLMILDTKTGKAYQVIMEGSGC